MSRVVVLGGTGFVGRHVVEHARSAGHDVTVLSRRTGCDAFDLAQLTEQLADSRPEFVVNCAADVGSIHHVSECPADIIDANMRMQLNVFLAVQRTAPHAVLINPIANCAYPGFLEVYAEDRFWDGPLHSSVSSYGSTRRMMMVLSECYARQHKLRVVNFLVPNMYGPYDSSDPNKAHALNALAAKVVKASLEGDFEIEVWGTGTAVREWLFAGDFASVVVDTMTRPDDPCFAQPLNVGQRRGYTVREIVESIVAECGYAGDFRWDAAKPDGAPRKVMDDARFRLAFSGFTFSNLQQGIRATLAYYRSIYPYDAQRGDALAHPVEQTRHAA
ncbi:MAG: NAD-dependent epimerase/dehydratase family protein [Planctomycetia bacterium]|nr:NAD-dependent epimerase/dehydratase family protein [Planctomycetia bacterium]